MCTTIQLPVCERPTGKENRQSRANSRPSCAGCPRAGQCKRRVACRTTPIRDNQFQPSQFADDVRLLSQVSNAKGLYALGVQWAVIVATGGLAVLLSHWAAYLLSVIVIGTRQHALAILMHDAAHYRLLRNRTLNDLVSNLFAAFPLGICTSLYRATHFQHHSHTNTERDPDWVLMHRLEDWQWPKLQWQCVKVFVRDLLGLNALKQLRIVSQWSPFKHLFEVLQGTSLQLRLTTRELTSAACFSLFGVGLLAITNSWFYFLLLWVVPQLTVLVPIFKLRGIAEHLGVAGENNLNRTRTVIPSLIERFLIAPLGVNFHLEHHLFPSVPCYNLSKLHKQLMNNTSFRSQAHLTQTYTGLRQGVLAELLITS